MIELREFRFQQYKKDLPIMIYGATVGGKIVQQLLQREGLSAQCFIDRAKAGEIYSELPVEAPCYLEEHIGVLIIAVTRAFDSVQRYLEGISYHIAYICKELISNKSGGGISAA